MKIKTKSISYEQFQVLEPYKRVKPLRQIFLFRWLILLLSVWELWFLKFRFHQIGMEKLGKQEPCLILMNHSSFLDLKIIGRLFHNRPYHIVSTLDSFVGKKWLLRLIGCIPTKKFIMDAALVKDMVYCIKNLNGSIVMFPEAGYSMDGTSTTLPDTLGKCLKVLNVPVVMVTTYGAFSRDPLYNGLQLRKVPVSAEVKYLLSQEDVKEKSTKELNAILHEAFSFDQFRWQQENGIKIRETFRADFLNRLLYKCPHCLTDGQMEGKGTFLTCHACGQSYELTEEGFLHAFDGETKFHHIPDWYRWERDCVRQELLDGSYSLDELVDIYVLTNARCLYQIGEGRLTHTKEGFHLTGCDGKLDYFQKAENSYTLNSDFYWYEIGDVISIGTLEHQFYCFPKNAGDLVAKTRLATEELYKLKKNKVL